MKMPTNLDECIEFLDYQWSNDDKNEFMNMEEENAINTLHFTTGRGIRNEWKLWDEDSPLSKYFDSIGIHHADDMSSIILTSFHRYLNKEEIELEKQVKIYQDYWKQYEKI